MVFINSRIFFYFKKILSSKAQTVEVLSRRNHLCSNQSSSFHSPNKATNQSTFSDYTQSVLTKSPEAAVSKSVGTMSVNNQSGLTESKEANNSQSEISRSPTSQSETNRSGSTQTRSDRGHKSQEKSTFEAKRELYGLESFSILHSRKRPRLDKILFKPGQLIMEDQCSLQVSVY